MSLEQRKKIAAVVINAVMHDARVIKEAESLTTAGFEVKLFGIENQEPTHSSARTSGGVPVQLVAWRGAYFAGLYTYRRPLLAAALIFLALLSFALYWLIGIYLYWLCRYPLLTLSLTFFTLSAVTILLKWLAYSIWLETQLANNGEPAKSPAAAHSFLGKLGPPFQFLTHAAGHPLALFEDLKIAYDRAIRARGIRKELLQAILDFAPDYVHCHDAGTLPVGLAVRRLTRAALVYDSHEIATAIANADALGRLAAWYREQQAASHLAAVITVNPYIATHLKAAYPAFPEPVVICNAARLPSEPPGPDTYDGRLHRAAEIERTQRILLFQGGFAKHRGLVQTLKSALALPDDWVLVFMGWGSYEKALRKMAHGIDPQAARIRFIPPAPQPELIAWTAGATLGIIPYENVSLNHWFCSPNKIWEYAAASVPCLASPFPFLRDVVEANAIGWLLDSPLTPASIARSVRALDDQALAQARDNCRRFIERDNWSVYEKRLVALYREIGA